MKQIMQQMLQDVIDQFSPNPEELRSASSYGKCTYHPSINKPKSIGCAIGMYIGWESAKALDRRADTFIRKADTSIRKVINARGIPKWMKKIDIDFLSDLQYLHDNGSYWRLVGLSTDGMYYIATLCNKFKLDYEKLVFFPNK